MKVPARPFQGAPKTFDLTNDTAFEHKWQKIHKFKSRPKPSAKFDPVQERAKYIFDRRTLDAKLFEDFQDQGEEMRKMELKECTVNKEFWATEAAQQEDARAHIKNLAITGPYDYFKLDP